MTTEFRVFFDDQPAPRNHLERIEEITVEQEIDTAWEARLAFLIKMDEQGRWKGEQTLTEPFSRMRIEVKVDRSFIPLIDGPVVDYESDKQAEPGRSTLTLVVQDDSVLLNREDDLARFDNRLDHEIAEQLFDDAPIIWEKDVASTPAPSDDLPRAVAQRGTAMQLLRRLARRQGMHAYVLPGERPGESIGCFKPLPSGPASLRPLVFAGPDRNMDSFNVMNNVQLAAQARAASVSASDKQIVRGRAAPTDFDLLGERPAAGAALPPERFVGRGLGTSVDIDRQAEAAARAASYSFEAYGQVRHGCYRDVLRPYRIVTVHGVNPRWSGRYVVRRATHTLTRSSYGQSFAVMRDAESAASDESVSDVIRRLF